MTWKNAFIAFLFIVISIETFAKPKKNTSIQFQINHTNSLEKLEPLLLESGDTVQIQQLKIYVSKIQFLENEKVVWIEKNSFHLIDFSKVNNLIVSIPSKVKFNKIQFVFGIDSLTQVSGVFGGDLDPTKGMYWTWQSGYIHFKMEGLIINKDLKRDEIQLHIGGFTGENNTIQKVSLALENQDLIKINFDIKAFSEIIYQSKQKKIMSPSAESKTYSTQIASLFSIAP